MEAGILYSEHHPTCSAGRFQEEACFLGPWELPAMLTKPEESMYPIYKKQRVYQAAVATDPHM